VRLKLTITLLLLNIVLGIFLFYLHKNNSKKNNWGNENNFVFPPGTVQATTSIEIKTPNSAQNWGIKRDSQNWKITSPIQWAANNNAVTQITTQLESLKWETKFPVSDLQKPLSLADYGLENSGTSITLAQGIQKTKILIGQATGVGNNLYILSPDRKEVMIVAREPFRRISISPNELRSQKLFDISLYEVHSLAQETSPDNKVLLIKDKNQWTFELPLKTFANNQAVESTLIQLLNTEISTFVQPNIVEQGLDKPSMRITLQENKGRHQTILIGNPVPPENENHPQYYYAKLDGANPSVFVIPAKIPDNFKEIQVQLRERKILRFDPATLTAIDISDKENSLTLQKLENGAWQVLPRSEHQDIITWAVDPQIVNEAILALSNLETENFVTDAPSQADIQNLIFNDLKLKITIKTNKEQTLLIGSKDLNFYAKKQSSDSIYQIDPEILYLIPTNVLAYRLRILDEQPKAASIVSLKLTQTDPEQTIYLEHTIDETNELPSQKREAIRTLIDILVKFEVKKYITDHYSQEHFQINNIIKPWKYKLEAKVAMPRIGEEPHFKTLHYTFTERLGGTTQYGGSPDYNVTFTCNQKLIDIIEKLTSK
jgi:hypothetical protein